MHSEVTDAITTIQVRMSTRDKVKAAAKKRAGKMGLKSLSMDDYLNLVADTE